MKKGVLLVLSGPSGCGKGTVCKRVLKNNSDYQLSTSVTTRQPRKGELDGRDYYFVSKDEYDNMVKNSELLEHAQVHSNFYGTPKTKVLEKIEEGQVVILEIDVQGALQVKERYEDAVLVFLLPPSIKELRKRLEGRGTETKEIIDMRMKNAYEEIDLIDKYDYLVYNDSLNIAVEEIECIIKAEKLKINKNSEFAKEFISKGE